MKTFFALCSVLSLISAPALAQTSNEYKLGMASFQTKNYKEASIFFLGAMSSEPKNPKAFYYAGYCLYLTGRKEDAFKTFKLLVNTFPNSKECFH
jgi:TolA-binding protein